MFRKSERDGENDADHERNTEKSIAKHGEKPLKRILCATPMCKDVRWCPSPLQLRKRIAN